MAAAVRLPQEFAEASGAAVSLDHPGVVWSHNDSGSTLFAIDLQGRPLARFRVQPRLRDWEDVALSTCPDGGSCLYLADLGDNYEERSDLKILRVREPDPSQAGPPISEGPPHDTLVAEVFPVRLPEGAGDIEALLVLPGERVFAVSKGRNDAVTVFRYPGPLRPDTVTLDPVQRLSSGPRFLPRQVTGGSVSPDRGVVALRTYEAVHFYRMVGDTLVELPDARVSLALLQEPQGEGVGLGLNGTMVLTSEGGPLGGDGSLVEMRCRLDRL